ncbi:hypothetical protein BDQ17DRAFT_1394045 [Cyathus striatus]|nr:hypothetical protein BDQ17DRAFT_1394045 [Cyathus striatus]
MSHNFTTTPYSSNPLKTRSDVTLFLTGLLDALATHTSPGGARIHLGYTATHYDDIAAQLEGFSRPIWGLASLLSGRMVECSAIGFALAVAKEKLWDGMSVEKREGLEKWLGGMNDKAMPNTNWLWFRVFANMGLHKVGSSLYNAKRMLADLDHLDTFYIGGGWSRDDYYSSSFAIQFAQLTYSRLMQSEDPARCAEYRNRAKNFALDFLHYFDSEGRAVPFGRSMTYRFAMSSFWSAFAFAFTEYESEIPAPLTWGVLKGLQLRNIRYWARQPGAYNPDGTLTIGYNYPNHAMTENYNSPGSPYWCCKSFLCLSLPETHLFWTAEEEPYPSSLLNTVKPLTFPLHIATNLGGHTYILSSGQQCSYHIKQSAAKYGKLAYSAAFGYSVPVGSGSLEELGGDSTLALSDDSGETWKVRRETRNARIEGGVLRSMWFPWKGVEVETWLVPPTPEAPLWHIRIHRIKSDRPLRSAEGGWAIYGQGADERALELLPSSFSEEYGTWEGEGEARASSRVGISGIISLPIHSHSISSRTGKAIRTDANSNLVWARAVLPTLMGEHEPGEVWVACAVFGLPAREGEEGVKGWSGEWGRKLVVPKVEGV